MSTDKLYKWLNVVWLVIRTATAIALIASAYGGVVSPEVSVLPALFAMTFPIWVAICLTIIAVDLSVKRMRKYALIPIVALVLCTGPILTFSPLNFNTEGIERSENDGTFTLLSYNVYHLHDICQDSANEAASGETDGSEKPNPTIDYVLSTDADVLCLQESQIMHPNKSINLTRQQVDSVHNRYIERIYNNGMDIMSRYPMKRINLRQPPEPSSGWFGAAVADIDGHETLLVSVHLESIGLTADDRALYIDLTKGDVHNRQQMGQVKHRLLSKLSHAFRMREKQAKLLREQIDSIGIKNVIIAGDFNDIPGCYAIRELSRDDFTTAFAEAGFGPQLTYHSDRFFFHIDHILYRGDMKAVGYRRDSFKCSDHYPVMARFKWNDSDN